MNLKVICECKNAEVAGQFICSVEPDHHGNYNWLMENKDGRVFGGKARTQQEAINQALKPKV